MHTDDVNHEGVGSPLGVLDGPATAEGLYRWLTQPINAERMDLNLGRYADNLCVKRTPVARHSSRELMSMAGNGRRITFRMSLMG